MSFWKKLFGGDSKPKLDVRDPDELIRLPTREEKERIKNMSDKERSEMRERIEGMRGKIMTIPQLAKSLEKLMGTGSADSTQVMADLGIECSNCGQYTKEAIQLLVISAMGGLKMGKSHFFADPKMAECAAAFERGQCPCGAKEFRVTFSDTRPF